MYLLVCFLAQVKLILQVEVQLFQTPKWALSCVAVVAVVAVVAAAAAIYFLICELQTIKVSNKKPDCIAMIFLPLLKSV